MRTRVLTLESGSSETLPAAPGAQLLARVEESGALLLRGFHWDQQAFETFTRSICKRFYRIASRERLAEGADSDGFTARAPEFNITLLAHSEATYRPFTEPDYAFFGCVTAPLEAGGEGLIVDGRAFYARLPTTLKDRFESQGVIFESQWPAERWLAEFEVSSREALGDFHSRYPHVDWKFEGDIMHYRCRRAAIHPDRAGQPVFCNAILAHLPEVPHPGYRDARAYALETNQVRFGDGEVLSQSVINTLIDIQDEVAYEHRLADNDVMVLDNSRVMHGRRPLARDCPRVLLTRFGYLEAQSAFEA